MCRSGIMSASIPTTYSEDLKNSEVSSNSYTVGGKGFAIGVGISSESEPTNVAADDFFEGKGEADISSK